MNVILVDDEKHILENMSILMEEHFPEINILGTASNALEAIKLINHLKPEVVFLDISMPHGSGFEVLDAFDLINFEIVFVTAHQEYAIEAIKRNAFDYILKPIRLDELERCVEKLKNTLLQKEDYPLLTIHTSDSIEFVNIKDIVYCKAEGSYCHIHLAQGPHFFFSKHLKQLEEQLPAKQFQRCHNSYIINKDYVLRYAKNEACVVLSVEIFIPVSRARKDQIISWLGT